MSEVLDTCVLCLWPAINDDPATAKQLNLTEEHGVARCCSCGFRFLTPRPTRTEYETMYRDGSGPLAADYPVSHSYYFEEERSRLPEYRVKLRELIRAGAGPRLLEIGACAGTFLSEARRWGFEVQGIEPSETNRRMALERHGLHLEANLLEEQDFPPDTFDVVFSSNVFEHLMDPLAAILRVRRWLKPGSLLLIEVPNQFESFAGRRRRWLGRAKVKPRSFLSIHHTMFFSRRTLRLLISRADLQTCRVRNVYYRMDANRFPALRGISHLIGTIAGGSGVIEILARKPSEAR
jgi:SAM-dependent methyltransferase